MPLQRLPSTMARMAIQAHGAQPVGGDRRLPLHPRVLVVHAAVAFATAAVERLVDHCAMVEIARPEEAVRRLADHGRYEAVVLGPYLRDGERERVLASCLADAGGPALLEVRDARDGVQVAVYEPPARAEGRPREALAPLIEALSGPFGSSKLQPEWSDSHAR